MAQGDKTAAATMSSANAFEVRKPSRSHRFAQPNGVAQECLVGFSHFHALTKSMEIATSINHGKNVGRQRIASPIAPPASAALNQERLASKRARHHSERIARKAASVSVITSVCWFSRIGSQATSSPASSGAILGWDKSAAADTGPPPPPDCGGPARASLAGPALRNRRLAVSHDSHTVATPSSTWRTATFVSETCFPSAVGRLLRTTGYSGGR